jgi:hypothetical protein
MLGLTGLELLQGIKVVRQEHAPGLVHREDPTLQPRDLPSVEGRGIEVDGSAPRQEDEIVEIGPRIGHKDRVMGKHLGEGPPNGRECGVVPAVREGHKIEGEGPGPTRVRAAGTGPRRSRGAPVPIRR